MKYAPGAKKTGRTSRPGSMTLESENYRTRFAEAARIVSRWNIRHENKQEAFSILHGLEVQTATWQEYQRHLRGEINLFEEPPAPTR